MKVAAIVFLTDERNGNTVEIKLELPPTNEIHMRQGYELEGPHEIDRVTTANLEKYVKRLFNGALVADGAIFIVSTRQLHGG